MRKRDLIIENGLLKAEVAFLRGQLAQSTQTVDRTLKMAFPSPETTQAPVGRMAIPMPDMDWTDTPISDEDINGLTIKETLEEEDGRWNVEMVEDL